MRIADIHKGTHDMDKRAALSILADFRRALASHGVENSRLILFGSHADGTAREHSDIDVVVVSEDFADKSHWERITLLSKAICDCHPLIEAIPMTPREWEDGNSLIAAYAREGEEVPG